MESKIKSDRGYHFQDLIFHRVHEILLVASPYDAFVLEEDGRLTEQILNEYTLMNLTNAPRVWHAATAGEATQLFKRRKFDLVIVMLRIADMDPLSFSTQIKQLNPKMPVILLATDESELKALPDLVPETAIDRIFIWSGNSNVFLAIVKYLEDKMNVRRDVKKGNVRCIILVEDSPRYYSVILPMIYKEITYHTKNLMNKALSDSQRLLQLRARPKILLASTYEEAETYFKRFQANVLGLISDIRFPRGGEIDPQAGVELAHWVRSREPQIPIMLQSRHEQNRQLADSLKAHFLYKESNTLLLDLRDFIVNNFGFGDFLFRLPNGEVIDQATNLTDLIRAVKRIPVDSMIYHASSNHFSNWLAARGEFRLASKIRPLKTTDFATKESHREYMLGLMEKHLRSGQTEPVVDFSSEIYSPAVNFIRIGEGSLGGKARGLAFINALIEESNLTSQFPAVTFRIPRVAVIGADEFDRFMNANDLWDLALSDAPFEEIEAAFLQAALPKKLVNLLARFLSQTSYPLAVRSSSLLEDSQYQPLAGMYSTYMLPNSARTKKERLAQLQEAIIRVYISTYHHEPKALIESSVHRHEEERMAVIIMELVGQRHEQRFYPTISGSAQSYNYYPVSYMRRDEGVAFIALGLGRTIVEGGKALRFAPKYPAIIPQFYSVKATIESSQHSFYALNMDQGIELLQDGEEANLEAYELEVAEADGVLSWAGSVVCEDDHIIRDSLQYQGTRVVTFAPVLKWKRFPLAELLTEMLRIGEKALGCPVEIEFAVNIFPDPRQQPEFCLLQIKPMVTAGLDQIHTLEEPQDEDLLCRSSIALGNGVLEGLRNVIMVDPQTFDPVHSPRIAREIETLNRRLYPDEPYILVGPGRWGSADPWLGVPVNWQQISGSKVIVEIGQEKYPIDPSFGSHFFQNVTSMRIGYFTIDHKNTADRIDLEWLNQQPCKQSNRFTKWIQLEHPVEVRIDGKTGQGLMIKPEALLVVEMDEEESPGI